MLPGTARALLQFLDAAMKSDYLRRLAFLSKCSASSPPGHKDLFEGLWRYRDRYRSSYDRKTLELIWIALAHCKQVLMNIAMRDGSLLQTLAVPISSRYPTLLLWRAVQPNHSVPTYSVRKTRITMELLHRQICCHWWHRETCALLQSITDHCLGNLIPGCGLYPSEDHIPHEDPIYDDNEWCNKTKMDLQHTKFHCNKQMILATEAHLRAMQQSNHSRERWRIQIVVPSIPADLLERQIRDTLGWICDKRWNLDLLEDSVMKDNFGNFFIYPGEAELVHIKDPDAPAPNSQQVISRLRPQELTQATKMAISRTVAEQLQWRLLHMRAYLTNGANLTPGEPQLRVDRAQSYDWRRSHGDLPPQNLTDNIEAAGYSLVYMCAVGVRETNVGCKGCDSTLYSTQKRGRWQPLDPREWGKDLFPCLVQCNDWRYHVALDHETLLVCPNVETAHWIWKTLRSHRNEVGEASSSLSLSLATQQAESDLDLLEAMK